MLARMSGVNKLTSRRMIEGKRTQVVCWLIEPTDPNAIEIGIDLSEAQDDLPEYEEPIRIAA